jgi:cell division protease FtsH
MSVLIDEKDLPVSLTAEQAVEAAYATELAEVASKLQRGLPSLIECDKDLAPYLFVNVRNRLKVANLRCLYLDGRPRPDEPAPPMPMGLIGTMIAQLRDAVRGAVEKRVVVLPHLDLLTTSQGGLTAEAREVIPLLYENPELVWLGFKDPSFPLPKVIENLFLHRTSLLGAPRPKLRFLITQKESRKFGRQFNPWSLYKHVSGVNAVRLRKLLATLEGEDYPADPRHALRQLRQATLVGHLEVPAIDLDREIGGYAKVKQRLKSEILDVLAAKDKVTDVEEMARLEELLPKGMIFWGPPGTGKTMFAKAMAASIGAAVTVVSGPELKSKWVGESEENLRRIFYQARQAAPSIIVFDELDSFATARGTYTGSGVEHSMVNQLLTEMDGFHKEELVFIVGTTNFVESLDPALLRPGRFEFHLHIPYPNDDDRRDIIKIYDKKMRLKMSPETLEHAVRRTDFFVPGAAAGTLFSGDHLNALCRAIARRRLRDNRSDDSTPKDVEQALLEWIDRQTLREDEKLRVARHEAGHAVLNIAFDRRIIRIALTDDVVGALGYVRPGQDGHAAVQTHREMLDTICILFGGREAERLLCDDVTAGAGSDLAKATQWARELVEVYGLGDDDGIGHVVYAWHDEHQNLHRRRDLSPEQQQTLDRRVRQVLEEQRLRANDILGKNKGLVEYIAALVIGSEMKALTGQELADGLRSQYPEFATKLQKALDRESKGQAWIPDPSAPPQGNGAGKPAKAGSVTNSV